MHRSQVEESLCHLRGLPGYAENADNLATMFRRLAWSATNLRMGSRSDGVQGLRRALEAYDALVPGGTARLDRDVANKLCDMGWSAAWHAANLRCGFRSDAERDKADLGRRAQELRNMGCSAEFVETARRLAVHAAWRVANVLGGAHPDAENNGARVNGLLREVRSLPEGAGPGVVGALVNMFISQGWTTANLRSGSRRAAAADFQAANIWHRSFGGNPDTTPMSQATERAVQDALRHRAEQQHRAKRRRREAEMVGGIIGAGLGVALVPLTLGLSGFTAAGLAAGSAAVAWQSSIGSVAAGSLFSILQSVGAGGAAMGSLLAAGGAVGGAAGAAVGHLPVSH